MYGNPCARLLLVLETLNYQLPATKLSKLAFGLHSVYAKVQLLVMLFDLYVCQHVVLSSIDKDGF